ncbi:hypothetical protein C7974DRAFT_390005 [Boeremia exigua]|uniref:uncharacterized protein n=1 Tax=Boeremia exigua TaxID=749465 RepID=UPI001E8D2F7B|nr:uncharacterized protein C7974DRAFT_390005 [Boeremia exigua]KAH6637687.1 hypothetical protein C7974DRAFT_390005 [Boeremia exigua]
MTTEMQGPYADISSVRNDEESAIELRPTTADTKTHSDPSVSTAHLGPSIPIAQAMKALIPAAIMILVIFWINASHIYGLFHHQGEFVHRAKVALADFDGGDFGEGLRLAAATNNGTYGNPTYVSVDTVGSTSEQIRHEVFKGTYWAAIIVEHGATARFKDAIDGSAEAYNPDDVYKYYVLDARYYTIYASSILSPVIATASTAASVFSAQFITPIIARGQHANATTALSALASPARPVEMPAAPQLYATLDDKAFINTLGAVLPILMQFFFIMAWNGICNGMHFYAAHDLRTHILSRLFCGTVWPVFTSLCIAGWTFAFRGSYSIDVKMFFAFWAVTWVYCMISFDVLDIATGFIPMAFVPFFVLTWIIWNVVASLGPPEILHQWFRINYFFPSLHWFRTFITIITQGALNDSRYTLPVLAVWLVLMKCLSPLATRHRVRKAHEIFQWYKERNAIGGPH